MSVRRQRYEEPAPHLLPLTDITPRLAAAMLATYSGRQPQMQSGIEKMSAVLRAEPGADVGYASFREGTLRNAIHRLGAIRDTGIMGRMRILHDGSFETFKQRAIKEFESDSRS